jgi:pachytene checkpoint protein 2
MSGRSLRRLPVLAHARYGIGLNHISTSKAKQVNGVNGVQPHGTEIEQWLCAMEKVVDDQGLERAKMEH